MMKSTPSFTKAMRGYDIEEVDSHLETLQRTADERIAELSAAQASNQALRAEVEQLRGRIAELEECVRSETPRSIAALGERLTLVLEEAEAGAQDAMRQARTEADAILSAAQRSIEQDRLVSVARVTDAEQRANATLAHAEERATSLEASARSRAEQIVAEAEQRALARRAEIEAWVERVRTHIENEEQRAAEEFARARAVRAADLASLRRDHEQLISGMERIGAELQRTVSLARGAISSDDQGLAGEAVGRLDGRGDGPFESDTAAFGAQSGSRSADSSSQPLQDGTGSGQPFDIDVANITGTTDFDEGNRHPDDTDHGLAQPEVAPPGSVEDATVELRVVSSRSPDASPGLDLVPSDEVTGEVAAHPQH